MLDDNANPRVQAHGAAALVNFSEECPKAILSQYLDVIILKLEEVLNSKFKEVRVLDLVGASACLWEICFQKVNMCKKDYNCAVLPAAKIL